MRLSTVLRGLKSDKTESVTNAARALGLLLERTHFSRQGEGTLGELDPLLGDLSDAELTDELENEIVYALIAHVETRSHDANPTVIWAIGKANNPGCLGPLARLTGEILFDPDRSELLYQLVSVLSTVAPAEYRDLLLRIASEGYGAAAELVRQLMDTHAWDSGD